MTSGPPLARLAAKVLVEAARQADPSGEEERARAIAALARALRDRTQQRRRRLRLSLGFAAAAAAGLLVAGATKWFAPRLPSGVSPSSAVRVVTSAARGSVLVTGDQPPRTLVEGTVVRLGDRVVAQADGLAALTLETGTRLTIDEGGDVSLVEQGTIQRFYLAAGAVRADVAKLAPGQRFFVRTVDAEIEVRGTSFRVMTVPPDPGCGDGIRTRVVVYEGLVAVRAASSLSSVRPGETWPSGCDPRGRPAPLATLGPPPVLPAPPSPAAAASSVTATPRAATSSAVPVGPASSRERAQSLLALQNQIFDEAIEAKRRGDSGAAISEFERLLAQYPSGPLAETAAAERMKLLAVTDRARAVTAAKEYLARYPTGFARSEAEALVARGP